MLDDIIDRGHDGPLPAVMPEGVERSASVTLCMSSPHPRLPALMTECQKALST
ncbi:hypothetical protein [Sorangium sp. So ce1078]|uniref:hypothetical protein n=1 Tax=Sorangium sp. So ce1078 TaxID=3133329 RepID=UPI003F62ED0B